MTMETKETRQDCRNFLGQYVLATMYKKELIKRFELLQSNFCTNGNYKTSIAIRLDEIKMQIDSQIKEMENSLATVMEVIDFLPIGSIDRRIIEARYIDSRPWKKIETEMYISRSAGAAIEAGAIDMLMSYELVRTRVDAYKKRQDTKGRLNAL